MDCHHWQSFRGVASFECFGHSEIGLASLLNGVGIASSALLPHLVLLGQWDLHDAAVLYSSLGIRKSTSLSESELLLCGYEKWGEDLPAHLSGFFSFAIWNARNRSLFACRDRLGFLPFVYRSGKGQFIFAGDMQTMLEDPECPRVLNPQMLAACKVIFGYRTEPGATFFSGLTSLPPGHFLTASSGGTVVRKYWEPTIRPELVPTSEGAVYEKTRDLVERAVENRVVKRSSVGLMYSGGLDSSVLAVVAAKVLKKRNRSFTALGAVNENEGIADEKPFMEKLAGLDNMTIVHVSAPGRGPFDGIEDPALFHTSAIRYSRVFLNEAVSAAAQSRGVDVLLNGAFGETTISATAPYLLECAVRMRVAALWKEFSGCRRASAKPLRILAAQAWRHIRPRNLPDSYYLSPHLLASFPPRLSPRDPLWPDSGKNLLNEAIRFRDCDSLLSTRPRDRVFSPTLALRDPDLLEFCLALPVKFRFRHGVGRYLIRRAFATMLPSEIAWRRCKAPYSPDYPTRYNRQLGKAVDFVGAIRKSDPVRDVVDIEKLRAAIRPIPSAVLNDPQAMSAIPQSIYLINFLRHFPAFRI